LSAILRDVDCEGFTVDFEREKKMVTGKSGGKRVKLPSSDF
jgi:hypothetical protein